MARLLPLLLVLVLAAGCTSEDSADSPPADTAATAPASPGSTSNTPPDTADLPPSRAGRVQPASDYEEALSALLAQVVTDDALVRYDRLRGPLNERFRRILKAVEDYDASQLQSQEEKLAFWINAYNVQMLANVLQAWPVRDVSSHDAQFFNQPLRTAGTALSLDHIEQVILRRQEGPERAEALQVKRLDPRLHAAVNCAARSCPKLRRRAFLPQTVEAQLDQAMRDFTGSPDHFQHTGERFVLNSILKWYGTDFDYAGNAAGDYLLSFMPERRPGYEALRRLLDDRTAQDIQQHENVSFQYDWTLNATPASLPPKAPS